MPVSAASLSPIPSCELPVSTPLAVQEILLLRVPFILRSRTLEMPGSAYPETYPNVPAS